MAEYIPRTITTTSMNIPVVAAPNYDHEVFTITDRIEDKILEILNNLNSPRLIELKCRECGASINQLYDDHIIKCPYCKSVYITGIKMYNG